MNFLSYEDARDIIEDGDIVFLKGNWKSPTNALIMFFTDSSLYHVGIAFWIHTADSRRLMIVEAHGRSTRRILNLSFYEDFPMLVVKAPKPWKEIACAALGKLGKVKYGYLEAGYIGVRDIALKLFNVVLPFRDLPAEVCSSFVADAVGLEDTAVTPQKLYEQLLAITQVKQKVEA